MSERRPARPTASAPAAVALTFGRAADAPRRDEAQLAMTPMIDVVFLLIVFFMCTQFRTHEGELLAKLPPRSGLVRNARVVDQEDLPTARIYVSQGIGGPRYVLNGATLETPDRLFPALAALRDRTENLEAVLDGDDDLPFERFLFAFNECLRAGIRDVSFVRPQVPTPED